MTTAASIALTLGVAVVVIVALAVRYRFESRRLPIRQTVLVVLIDGATLRGVLISRTAHLVELAGAELLNPDRAPDRIDGSVYVDARNVRWIQHPNPEPSRR